MVGQDVVKKYKRVIRKYIKKLVNENEVTLVYFTFWMVVIFIAVLIDG
jgi:hypothetical protein